MTVPNTQLCGNVYRLHTTASITYDAEKMMTMAFYCIPLQSQQKRKHVSNNNQRMSQAAYQM